MRRLALSRCNAFFVLEGAQFLPLELTEVQILPLTASPLLRSIALSGVHVCWANLPFRNLISLELNYHAQNVSPSLREFIAILNASPNMERLAIVGWGVRTFNGDSSVGTSTLEQSIDLPRLRHLILGWVNVRHTLKLFSLFTWRMPGLHTLELEDVSNSLDPSTPQDSSAILNYLSSNLLGIGSSLVVEVPRVTRYLRFNSIVASTQSFSQFMSGLQNLVVMSLHNIDDSFILSMASSWEDQERGTKFLCPALQRVRISPAGAVSEAVLEELASARGASVIKSGRLTEGKLEDPSRGENCALIIEVESLYDSDSEIGDQPDGGIEESLTADNSSHFFDQPLEGEAPFDYSGDETEPENCFHVTLNSPPDISQWPVRRICLVSDGESAMADSTILNLGSTFGVYTSDKRSYQKLRRTLHQYRARANYDIMEKVRSCLPPRYENVDMYPIYF